VRKTVTVLFCDLTGSTALGERLDPEALRLVMTDYFRRIADVLGRHGGTVEKFIGDAVMAVFGIPEVHEDDPVRAGRAAWDIRHELEVLNDELQESVGVRLQIRSGIATGEVVAGSLGHGPTIATGDIVNVAARLEQAAEPGDILLGATTHHLVRDAVRAEAVPPLSVKGKSEPLAAFRLLDVFPDVPGHVRRLDTPLVGRRHELRLIEKVFAELAAEAPAGLSYSSFRLADGVTFVHVVDGEGLTELVAFQEFQRTFDERLAEGPVRDDATLVGAYSATAVPATT
jgi:class 3 adenylate cyclase